MTAAEKRIASLKAKTASARRENRLTDENVRKIAEIEEKAKSSGTFSDRVAEFVARISGSMAFVWLNSGWFVGWILYNTIASEPFDPFPFTFLTLVVSLEAILLSIFILINQNRETAVAQRRNHLDLQVNLLAEQENTRMLNYLEAIAEKVGIETGPDELCDEMTDDIDPGELMEEIVRTTEDSGSN